MAEINIKRIWSSNELYSNHRIPGIIVTSKSTVIIYNEARKTKSDWAMMDIFMQRSTDHGETFGEQIYLAHGTEEFPTVNNPIMIEDKNNRLHLLYCRNYTLNGGGAWHRFSNDDGVTWSEPQDITNATNPSIHNVFAFGPGHGICTHDGILLVPVWIILKDKGVPEQQHSPSVISTFYSEDRGITWHLGEIIQSTESVESPNETVAVELSDGKILLNVRSFAKQRAFTISDNGKGGWGELQLQKDLPDPGCFGSIASINNYGTQVLLNVNCENITARTNIVIKASLDNANTWSHRRTIDVERGGYVDIATDNQNNLIYILYEEKYGKEVFLAKLTKEWLFGEN